MVDNSSPAGSWQREWDMRPHTTDEYRQEIRELRARIVEYMREIDELKNENTMLRATADRWVMEP